jgi:hypothetical protein
MRFTTETPLKNVTVNRKKGLIQEKKNQRLKNETKHCRSRPLGLMTPDSQITILLAIITFIANTQSHTEARSTINEKRQMRKSCYLQPTIVNKLSLPSKSNLVDLRRRHFFLPDFSEKAAVTLAEKAHG